MNIVKYYAGADPLSRGIWTERKRILLKPTVGGGKSSLCGSKTSFLANTYTNQHSD